MQKKELLKLHDVKGYKELYKLKNRIQIPNTVFFILKLIKEQSLIAVKKPSANRVDGSASN